LNAAPLVGGPQLKRVISGSRSGFGGICGIGADDLAYCWSDGPDSPGPVLIPRIASEQEP